MIVEKLIVIINNAIKINKIKIVVPFSKKIIPFLIILKKENYILGFKKNSENNTVTILFCYTYKKNKIVIIKPLSRPSQCLYMSLQDLWKFHKSVYTLILSTTFGVITHRTALKYSCGGKALCIIL